MGYLDGTRGNGQIPLSIRPAAFGAATFEYRVHEGRVIIENIQGLGGEVPGDQTVPRAEAWAATVLLSRVHPNAVARFGIDASYVTEGIAKRSRLEKGKNGDIWCVVSALLDLRKAELGISKVSSHLEAIGAQAVEAEFAFICDIIGNALADESAAIAAEWLEPKKAQCNEAEAIDNLAFMICIRLAFTQARIWEVTADSLLYEAAPEPDEVDLD